MPISHMYSPHSGTLLVFWQITEHSSELQRLYASEAYHSALPQHESQKNKSIAVRLAAGRAMQLLGIPDQSLRKSYEKIPTIDDGYLSLSHTDGLALAMVSTHSRVGVDVEWPKEQLRLVSKKFLSFDEQKFAGVNLDKLCALWAAKEAVYKACQSPGMSLKEDIKLILPALKEGFLFQTSQKGFWKVNIHQHLGYWYAWCLEGMGI